MVFDTREDEIASVTQWLSDRLHEGMMPHETGIFVRSENELDRARTAVEKSGQPFKVLDENVATTSGHISKHARARLAHPVTRQEQPVQLGLG